MATNNVFILTHAYRTDDGDFNDIIDVFSTRELAEKRLAEKSQEILKLYHDDLHYTDDDIEFDTDSDDTSSFGCNVNMYELFDELNIQEFPVITK